MTIARFFAPKIETHFDGPLVYYDDYKEMAKSRDELHKMLLNCQGVFKEFVEDVEGAIGCTDGDDIRNQIESLLEELREYGY